MNPLVLKPIRDMTPLTIVIPTLNGLAWLHDSIHTFLQQDYAGPWDILVIDSGSTDGTVEFLMQFERVQVHQIPPESFGHGTTRNLAVSMAKGDLVLMTVQDASPRTEDWLTSMVHALDSHGLDGVCGGQTVPPRPDTNPLLWNRHLTDDARVEVFTGEDYHRASPMEKMHMCSWDNVNALYKKTALEAQPFQPVRFGEDMTWARDWLEQGGKIGYARKLKVWHYHHQHPGFTRKRQIYTNYWRHRIFGVVPEPKKQEARVRWRGLKGLVQLIASVGIENPVAIINWIRYNRMVHKESALAQRDFHTAAAAGPEALDELYKSLGEKPPMATKKAHAQRP